MHLNIYIYVNQHGYTKGITSNYMQYHLSHSCALWIDVNFTNEFTIMIKVKHSSIEHQHKGPSLSLAPSVPSYDTMDMDGMVQPQVKYPNQKTPKSYKDVFD